MKSSGIFEIQMENFIFLVWGCLVLFVCLLGRGEFDFFSQTDNTAVSVLPWVSYHLSTIPPLPPVMSCHITFCHFAAVQPSIPNISTHLSTLEIKEKFI